MITYEDFKKLELRIGLIKSTEKIENSEKLLKLSVDFGELGEKQIIAGLAKIYAPESLIGTEAVFATNLEPRTLMGIESQGMILAADNNGSPIILKPEKETPPGSVVG